MNNKDHIVGQLTGEEQDKLEWLERAALCFSYFVYSCLHLLQSSHLQRKLLHTKHCFVNTVIYHQECKVTILENGNFRLGAKWTLYIFNLSCQKIFTIMRQICILLADSQKYRSTGNRMHQIQEGAKIGAHSQEVINPTQEAQKQEEKSRRKNINRRH